MSMMRAFSVVLACVAVANVEAQAGPIASFIGQLPPPNSISSFAGLFSSSLPPTVQAMLGSTTNPVTLFVPTNTALQNTIAAGDNITALVLSHIVPQDIPFLANGASFTTLQGSSITIGVDSTATTVIQSALGATLGRFLSLDIVNMPPSIRIHIIDSVLPFPAPALPAPTMNVLEIIANTPELSMFNAILSSPRYANLLGGLLSNPNNEFTVFGPSNAAFESITQDTGVNLDIAQDRLIDTIILYHIVQGVALNSDDFNVDAAQGGINDRVINSLQGQDLVLAIAALTGTKTVNTAIVTNFDILGTNGIVHVIDEVLVPPGTLLFDIDTAMRTDLSVYMNIGRFPELGTLADILQQFPEIMALLNGPVPLTFFAPTNDAFAEAIANGLDPANTEQVQEILTYHVISGVGLSTAAFLSETNAGNTVMGVFETVNGQNVSVSINAAGKIINDAPVVFADVVSSNGFIQIIDELLIPVGLVFEPAPTVAPAVADGETCERRCNAVGTGRFNRGVGLGGIGRVFGGFGGFGGLGGLGGLGGGNRFLGFNGFFPRFGPIVAPVVQPTCSCDRSCSLFFRDCCADIDNFCQ